MDTARASAAGNSAAEPQSPSEWVQSLYLSIDDEFVDEEQSWFPSAAPKGGGVEESEPWPSPSEDHRDESWNTPTLASPSFAQAESGGNPLGTSPPSGSSVLPVRLPPVQPHDEERGLFQCWICLEEDRRDRLLRPCACAAVVHPACLHEWRFSGINPTAYRRCVTCRYVYELEEVSRTVDERNVEERRKEAEEHVKKRFRFRVTVFVIVTLLVLLGFSAAFGALSASMDPDRNIPKIEYWCFNAAFQSLNHTLYNEGVIAEEFKSGERPVAGWYALAGWVLMNLCVISFTLIAMCFTCVSGRQPGREKGCKGRCTCCAGCRGARQRQQRQARDVAGGDCQCGGGGHECDGILALGVLALLCVLGFSIMYSVIVWRQLETRAMARAVVERKVEEVRDLDAERPLCVV